MIRPSDLRAASGTGSGRGRPGARDRPRVRSFPAVRPGSRGSRPRSTARPAGTRRSLGGLPPRIMHRLDSAPAEPGRLPSAPKNPVPPAPGASRSHNLCGSPTHRDGAARITVSGDGDTSTHEEGNAPKRSGAAAAPQRARAPTRLGARRAHPRGRAAGRGPGPGDPAAPRSPRWHPEGQLSLVPNSRDGVRRVSPCPVVRSSVPSCCSPCSPRARVAARQPEHAPPRRRPPPGFPPRRRRRPRPRRAVLLSRPSSSTVPATVAR